MDERDGRIRDLQARIDALASEMRTIQQNARLTIQEFAQRYSSVLLLPTTQGQYTRVRSTAIDLRC